ncbi:hypothetical protein HN51_028787, partial [Arachis hypogaea]
KNLDVAEFREEGPKHLDEMKFLFEDVVATGVGARAPSQDINDKGLEDELNNESTPPSVMRQKRRNVGRGDKRSRASQLSTQLERIINVFEEEKVNKIAHRNNVPTIKLIAKRSNREIFMRLEDSALQLGWLKTHSLVDVADS